MGLYDTIKNFKVSRSGSYFKAGFYTVEILHVKENASQQNATQVFFIVECKVLASTNELIKVDGEYSQVIDLTKIMGMPNVKGFVAAASGVDPMTEDEELMELVEAFWGDALSRKIEFHQVCELITSSDNPLGGMKLDLECVEIRTKEDKPFTKHKWMPLEEAEQAAG